MRVLFVFVLFLHQTLFSQCGFFISTFPYVEDFENNAAWTADGTNSDWAWGIPNHSLINSAFNGVRCWSVGGLNGSSYNANQQSYLISPCFDFTDLASPWISFGIFWENEYEWDGATLQYSLDEGQTWQNVGSYSDEVDCYNDNWFNHENVFWLTSASPKHGWSGREGTTNGSCMGGFGSEDWLEAKHCLNQLAGQSRVIFRFVFGSGNSCNDYDGFAIDYIRIENAPLPMLDYSFECGTENMEIIFNNESEACATNFQWNFSDLNASQNTSTLENPSHIFSSGGDFEVSLSSTGSCNQTATVTKTVRIQNDDIFKIDVSCFGENNGSASLNAYPNSTYLWSTNPNQTSSTVENLSPGIYDVTISHADLCPITIEFTIIEPLELTIDFDVVSTCESTCSGLLTANAVGGNAPYAFSWTGFGTGNSLFNLCEGEYEVFVTDANACSHTESVNLTSNFNPILTCEPANICIGSEAILEVSGAATYSWQPPTGLNTTNGSVVVASPSETTNYTITGTSPEGCVSQIEVLVSVSNIYAPVANFTYSPKFPDVYNNEVQFTNTSEGASNYQWSIFDENLIGDQNPKITFPNDAEGTYLVCLTASNSVACSNTKCEYITILGIPAVYVPNTFSPNGDENNAFFYPVLMDVDKTGYEFEIYNRWGERIFRTIKQNDKWDGTYKGNDLPNGVYIWKLKYRKINTEFDIKIQGHVTLRR